MADEQPIPIPDHVQIDLVVLRAAIELSLAARFRDCCRVSGSAWLRVRSCVTGCPSFSLTMVRLVQIACSGNYVHRIHLALTPPRLFAEGDTFCAHKRHTAQIIDLEDASRMLSPLRGAGLRPARLRSARLRFARVRAQPGRTSCGSARLRAASPARASPPIAAHSTARSIPPAPVPGRISIHFEYYPHSAPGRLRAAPWSRPKAARATPRPCPATTISRCSSRCGSDAISC